MSYAKHFVSHLTKQTSYSLSFASHFSITQDKLHITEEAELYPTGTAHKRKTSSASADEISKNRTLAKVEALNADKGSI